MQRWRQVLTAIRDHDIAKTEIGGKLPSERAYQEQFQCSAETIRRAMDALESSGLIEKRHKAAAIVTARQAKTVREVGFRRTANRKFNQQVVTETLDAQLRRVAAGEHEEMEKRAAKSLGIGKRPFVYLLRRRTMNGKPRVLHRSYLNPEHFPNCDLVYDQDFAQDSLLTFIQASGFQLSERYATLRARRATQREMADLDLQLEEVQGQLSSGRRAEVKVPPTILEVEQTLTAISNASSALVTVEFLHAVYVDWEYHIERGFE